MEELQVFCKKFLFRKESMRWRLYQEGREKTGKLVVSGHFSHHTHSMLKAVMHLTGKQVEKKRRQAGQVYMFRFLVIVCDPHHHQGREGERSLLVVLQISFFFPTLIHSIPTRSIASLGSFFFTSHHESWFRY